jgi:hypothetical protein
MTTRFDDDVLFEQTVYWGQLGATTLPSNSVTNAAISATAAIARTKLAQDSLKPYTIDFTACRVHDAIQTNLPGTAANDDLAIYSGTGGFGTDGITLDAGDLKAAGATTRYARFKAHLPAEYVDGETVSIRVRSAVETTVADTSCTVDIEAYRPDGSGGLSADLCTTAATSMNSTTAAAYDFTITPTTLVAGDCLDCRIAIACNDAATATEVRPSIYAIQLLCDVKG